MATSFLKVGQPDDRVLTMSGTGSMMNANAAIIDKAAKIKICTRLGPKSFPNYAVLAPPIR